MEFKFDIVGTMTPDCAEIFFTDQASRHTDLTWSQFQQGPEAMVLLDPAKGYYLWRLDQEYAMVQAIQAPEPVQATELIQAMEPEPTLEPVQPMEPVQATEPEPAPEPVRDSLDQVRKQLVQLLGPKWDLAPAEHPTLTYNGVNGQVLELPVPIPDPTQVRLAPVHEVQADHSITVRPGLDRVAEIIAQVVRARADSLRWALQGVNQAEVLARVSQEISRRIRAEVLDQGLDARTDGLVPAETVVRVRPSPDLVQAVAQALPPGTHMAWVQHTAQVQALKAWARAQLDQGQHPVLSLSAARTELAMLNPGPAGQTSLPWPLLACFPAHSSPNRAHMLAGVRLLRPERPVTELLFEFRWPEGPGTVPNRFQPFLLARPDGTLPNVLIAANSTFGPDMILVRASFAEACHLTQTRTFRIWGQDSGVLVRPGDQLEPGQETLFWLPDQDPEEGPGNWQDLAEHWSELQAHWDTDGPAGQGRPVLVPSTLLGWDHRGPVRAPLLGPATVTEVRTSTASYAGQLVPVTEITVIEQVPFQNGQKLILPGGTKGTAWILPDTVLDQALPEGLKGQIDLVISPQKPDRAWLIRAMLAAQNLVRAGKLTQPLPADATFQDVEAGLTSATMPDGTVAEFGPAWVMATEHCPQRQAAMGKVVPMDSSAIANCRASLPSWARAKLVQGLDQEALTAAMQMLV